MRPVQIDYGSEDVIQILFRMDATDHDRKPTTAPTTLADVLYAKQSKAPVPEAEWVALVRSIAAGDQAALHALYERSHRVVFTFAMRITSSRETAEEVTLDVFHDVWRRSSSYDEADGTVLGWIMNQTRSRAIDRLRFEQRKKRVPANTRDSLPRVEFAAPDAVIASNQQKDAIVRALGLLTLDERRAIEEAFFAESTYAEVATRLNEPLGTIKTRIRSALQKLRQTLAGERKRS
jgi:RNA polymerase sigma-70 factor, ECF subfamily